MKQSMRSHIPNVQIKECPNFHSPKYSLRLKGFSNNMAIKKLRKASVLSEFVFGNDVNHCYS